jgi:predicted deacetylase
VPKKFRISYSLPFFDPLSTRNFQTTTILHQVHGFSQVSTKKVGKYYQLKKLINQRKFTKSLEVLEKSGISGHFALFIIQNIQTLEVA